MPKYIALLLLTPSLVVADVYRHTDSVGHVLYLDYPPSTEWIKIFGDRKERNFIPRPATDEEVRQGDVIKMRSEIEYREILKKEAYRQKVRETAKFLDDVEAERKRH